MNKKINLNVFIFLFVFKMVFILFLFISYKTEQQIIKEQTPKEGAISEIKDIVTVINCMDCDGSGIFEYKLDNPMVEQGMVPEGTTETCQMCKGQGKLKECVRPNGMIYYMSLNY